MKCFFPNLLRIKNASFATFAAAVLLLSPQAHAIVDANSQNNTNAPSDGVPWDSVGTVNGASGNYLGAGWVLTAAHVGAGTAKFLGQNFAWDGMIYWLTNSDGTYADGVLYHLTSMPPLPRMPLVTSTPSTLSAVDMIGFGYISGSTQVDFWLGVSGFYWSALPTKAWGNNMVSGGAIWVFDGTTNLFAFPTTFDAAPLPQTSDECQAAPGDSGGGVFYKNGSTWELAGMIVAIDEPQTNRPGNTAVYTDATYSLDIATYRNQIQATIQGTVPTLSIARVGDNMKISWPDTGLAYSLQATTTFSPANWAVITPSEIVTNGQIVATVPMTTSTRFFRLHR
jgi:hypothetical protein